MLSFYLDDYDGMLDSIQEEFEWGFFSVLKQTKVAEEDGFEYYSYGCRILIPELKISIREGTVYDKETGEATCDCYFFYSLDEKDPAKFTDCFSNCFVSSLVGQLASQKKLNSNPMCFIDEQEMDFNDMDKEWASKIMSERHFTPKE